MDSRLKVKKREGRKEAVGFVATARTGRGVLQAPGGQRRGKGGREVCPAIYQ